MRPDDATNQAFEYCLAVAATKFGIELLFTVAMSNHHHTGIFDRDGRYPEFLEYFHKLFAKCQNALRGRWENFWASEQTSVVRLEGATDILDKLVYALTNPVKDDLVEKVVDWPGVSSYQANRTGNAKTVPRPKHFFRENGPMPETAELRFERPSEFTHLTQEEWATLVEKHVRRIELEARDRRVAARGTVLGRRRILSQSWSATPASREPRRKLRPTVAAKSIWRRVEALRRNDQFLAAYRRARSALASGYNFVTFPEGTYWMVRFMSVVCDLRPARELLAA